LRHPALTLPCDAFEPSQTRSQLAPWAAATRQGRDLAQHLYPPLVPPASAACVFCQIALGQLPAHLVYEDERCVAFLDNRPLFPGHVLLVPRAHLETITDLPDELVQPLFSIVRRLARAVEDAFDAEGSFVAINNRVSQSVPHLHVHVVPRSKGDGLRGFFWPRTRYPDDAAMAAAAARLRAALP
jgi:histidine triad (HIT) family protein